MSLAYSSEESRRAPREAIDCRSQIRTATVPSSSALIVNISPHGCMIRSDQAVPIGERLTVDVPGVGDLRGRVIWSLGARFGIEFEAPIALEPYLAMLSLLKESSDSQNVPDRV